MRQSLLAGIPRRSLGTSDSEILPQRFRTPMLVNLGNVLRESRVGKFASHFCYCPGILFSKADKQ